MPTEPSPRIPRASAVLAAMAVLGLAGCMRSDREREPPAPASLARADPLITAVQPTPKGVRVIARPSEPDLAGDTVREASRVARQLARAVQARAPDLPPGAQVITLELDGVDVDKFGKRTGARFFETDFDVGDLRGADLKAKGPAAVLNLAIDLRIDPAGVDPVNAWCMRYPHAGGDWCAMAGD